MMKNAVCRDSISIIGWSQLITIFMITLTQINGASQPFNVKLELILRFTLTASIYSVGIGNQ